MPETHEWMFYEVSWRRHALARPNTSPFWVRQYFRKWLDSFDGGLFDSKEAAFASNALYRYWSMVGVKDAHQEALVGQAGEVEPVYDAYSLAFFLFEPGGRRLHLPQHPPPDVAGQASLEQAADAGYLPAIVTRYRPVEGLELEQRVFATTLGLRQRSVAIDRIAVTLTGDQPWNGWLCLIVSPVHPSGFQRRDRAGRYLPDRRIGSLRYLVNEGLVEVNGSWGPLFDSPPAHIGCYGNPTSSHDPGVYLDNDPFADLAAGGGLNGRDVATDAVAGLCLGVFAWPLVINDAQREFLLDVKLPIDDYRGTDDLAELQGASADNLEAANRSFWRGKLDGSGFQAALPASVAHLFDLFRLSRATLLILADHGEIHPGPTIYDSFWIRDSAVEGIACALVGDAGLARTQFGEHYPRVFNLGPGWIGPARVHGFFGGEHEKNDWEWDSNGEALWAFGRLDRILGGQARFGAGLFAPYVLDGARWIRDNRSPYGLLHHGWSAEHVGDKDRPHYWDDFWAVAGLYEAARLSERLGAPETPELWAAYDDVRTATASSIRWAVEQQRARGSWETFIPTGPADVGRLDSTIVGALAYFHPCRLHMGEKLGAEVDWAARMTLETMWSHFVEGGFRHDSAWNAYAPYLTLQMAHAFLLTGDVARMDACLAWAVEASRPRVSRVGGGGQEQATTGAWNEQHAYPIAFDFARMPERWWYMGDIPHGWAAAEYLLLIRDALLFECDEDGSPHLYLAAGVPPHWLEGGETIEVVDAPTTFGRTVGYRLEHDPGGQTTTIELADPPPGIALVHPCRLGAVRSASADGGPVPVAGPDVRFPPGSVRLTVAYA